LNLRWETRRKEREPWPRSWATIESKNQISVSDGRSRSSSATAYIWSRDRRRGGGRRRGGRDSSLMRFLVVGKFGRGFNLNVTIRNRASGSRTSVGELVLLRIFVLDFKAARISSQPDLLMNSRLDEAEIQGGCEETVRGGSDGLRARPQRKEKNTYNRP
jgi:hypothetical protein